MTEIRTAEGAALRIGDAAKIAGTTPRTIRYYEEIGLLSMPQERAAGGHRLYGEQEVERLREIMRLRDLLGVSLDELKELLAAEQARAEVRAQLQRQDVDRDQRAGLLREALGHLERQLELVDKRSRELKRLRDDLAERRARVLQRLAAEDQTPAPDGPAPASAAGRATAIAAADDDAPATTAERRPRARAGAPS